MDMDAPGAQDMSYVEHVQKRHEEKGCLYAWGIVFRIACSWRVAAFVAMRLASVVWTFCVVNAPSVSPQKGLLCVMKKPTETFILSNFDKGKSGILPVDGTLSIKIIPFTSTLYKGNCSSLFHLHLSQNREFLATAKSTSLSLFIKPHRERDMDAPGGQGMSYMEHVNKRKEEKGCLYAWSPVHGVLLLLLLRELRVLFGHSVLQLLLVFLLRRDCYVLLICYVCISQPISLFFLVSVSLVTLSDQVTWNRNLVNVELYEIKVSFCFTSDNIKVGAQCVAASVDARLSSAVWMFSAGTLPRFILLEASSMCHEKACLFSCVNKGLPD
ncbi:hypothetical protein RHSIM_Rhsim08G0218300 [Rhododendron simsii]|uniref:Uncharacterized protein n=1 Tax=Rhododendron simsii TaxID=118357 RepID=A0A834GLB9_RHOSS|nr:hypothetical protein RHSIM_Rhsim08G0218300 [Rhododendron simsii]